MPDTTCEICKKHMDRYDLEEGYFLEMGWVRRRKEGGANALKDSRYMGQCAHRFCFESKRRSDKAQTSMFA